MLLHVGFERSFCKGVAQSSSEIPFIKGALGNNKYYKKNVDPLFLKEARFSPPPLKIRSLNGG